MIVYESRITPLRRSRLANIGAVIVVSTYVVTAVGIVVFCLVLSRI